MTHNSRNLHDVMTLGALFGTQPKKELLDLAVRLSHADADTTNLHVIEQVQRVAGPQTAIADADLGGNVVKLPRAAAPAAKTAER